MNDKIVKQFFIFDERLIFIVERYHLNSFLHIPMATKLNDFIVILGPAILPT